MADQDFNIKVVTTADTSGIKQTSAELDALRQKAATDPATLAARRASLAAQFPQGIPAEELEDSLKKATIAETELAAGGLLVGTNLGKARQEALVLARELATGGNVARTLGSLLGALGPAITIGGIGALVIYEQIKKSREEAEKLVAETARLGAEFEKAAISAQSAVAGARTGDDIAKVAAGVLPELEKLHAEADKLNQSTISGFQKGLEDLREGIIQMSPVVSAEMRQWAHPYTIALQEAQRQAQDNAEFADHEAKKRIERAQDFRRQFEDLEKLSPDEAVAKLTQRLQEAENIQKNLNKDGEDYVKSWIVQQGIIDRTKKDLQDYIKYQKELNKEVAGIGDAQSKAILRNEDAAKAAAKAGQERDAEMFQKSADAFRRAATPKELQDVDRVRQLQSGTRDTAAATQDIIKAIKDNTSISQMILDAWK